MKKGELARLICKPEYAYGANGSPPAIPPNATLLFEVELFSWKGGYCNCSMNRPVLLLFVSLTLIVCLI